MQIIRDITDDKMVLAFLQAEINSSRFGSIYRQILANSQLSDDLVSKANLSDVTENHIRKQLLDAVRGYTQRNLLFAGFPLDVKWKLIGINKQELDNLKYANVQTWLILSNSTRLVSDGANNIETIQTLENANDNIKAVAEDIRSGKTYPHLILASDNNFNEFILIEGHTRATAYSLSKQYMPETIEVIVGYSQNISRWAWY